MNTPRIPSEYCCEHDRDFTANDPKFTRVLNTFGSTCTSCEIRQIFVILKIEGPRVHEIRHGRFFFIIAALYRDSRTYVNNMYVHVALVYNRIKLDRPSIGLNIASPAF